MKMSRCLGLVGAGLLLANPVERAAAQWWDAGGATGGATGGTWLVAGSDNLNPGAGCALDQYVWIDFPVWELVITMPEAQTAGTVINITGQLVNRALGLALKIDGCTGQQSYVKTQGFPQGDIAWGWDPDTGSNTSGVGQGLSVTVSFVANYSGTITFEYGGVLGYRASARYRVITNERVAHWRFNGNWVGEGGQAPTQTIGLANPASWNGRVLEIVGAGDVIKYSALETDGYPNITRNAGTVRFWFRPAAVTGATRKLVDISSSAPWELRLNSSGHLQLATRLTAGGTEKMVQYTTPLAVNTWCHLAVTYSGSSATIYLNGASVASTSTEFQSSSVSLNGFSIGNGFSSQSNAALGQFDEFETFNYALSGSTISTDYAAFVSQLNDPDGDGVNSLLEITNNTNIYEADTDGDGYNDLVDYYPLDPTRWLAPPANNPTDTTAPTIELWAPLNT